jgi:hypothetical protein
MENQGKKLIDNNNNNKKITRTTLLTFRIVSGILLSATAGTEQGDGVPATML